MRGRKQKTVKNRDATEVCCLKEGDKTMKQFSIPSELVRFSERYEIMIKTLKENGYGSTPQAKPFVVEGAFSAIGFIFNGTSGKRGFASIQTTKKEFKKLTGMTVKEALKKGYTFDQVITNSSAASEGTARN